MAKILINLDADDKAWLDREAQRQQVPMTELVRQAILGLREHSRCKQTLCDLLERTAGLWREGDGLAWQQRQRDE